MVNAEAVEQFLANLGSSEQAVYETLKNRGIQGLRNISRQCPIARVLMQEFNTKAYVTSVEVFMPDNMNSKPYGEVFVPTTEAVMDFIDSFDAGNYPDLEEGNNGA